MQLSTARNTQLRRVLPLSCSIGGSQPEIDLHLLPRLAFDAPNPHRLSLLKSAHEATNSLIGRPKSLFLHQILVDAPGTQPGLHLRTNRGLKGLTLALAAQLIGNRDHFPSTTLFEPEIELVVRFESVSAPEPGIEMPVHFGPPPSSGSPFDDECPPHALCAPLTPCLPM